LSETLKTKYTSIDTKVGPLDFRFGDDAITNVLGCSIFYASDGECMV